MTPNTTKVLALLPPAPFTVGESTDIKPEGARAILDKRGGNALYTVATSRLSWSHDEEGHPQRVREAGLLAALWAKGPETLAALDGLLELVERIRTGDQKFPLGGTPLELSYARRVLAETTEAMLATLPADFQFNAPAADEPAA